VELYNTGSRAIPLSGISLYFANGIRGGLDVTEDTEWKSIALEGTIPAGGSFLILGEEYDDLEKSIRLWLSDDDNDIENNTLNLSNRAFKVALIKGNPDLTDIKNPFNTDGNGKKIAGYIDMLGAANDLTHDTNPDHIFGFETAPARCSASVAVRRWSLIDTDDNSVDFIAARYAEDGISDAQMEAQQPRNSKAGAWSPFAISVTSDLVILQANTYGNASGGFPRSLVELYNNSNAAINLGAGNYYLHVGVDTETIWNSIKLQGIIPAKSSFLIVDSTAPQLGGGNANYNATPRALLPEADQYAPFVLSNNGFKVALMKNRSTLSVINPFFVQDLWNDYVDVLGINAGTGEGFAAVAQSRPQITRRISLTDTNNNRADFDRIDIRTTAIPPMKDTELYKYWPRNSAAGPWNPMTGFDKVDPLVDPLDLSIVVGTGAVDALAGELLILQAYSPNAGAAGASHPFVELYNTTNAPIPLSGISLYYADGVRGLGVTEDAPWRRIALSGTIPAESSFLILGPHMSSAARLQIENNYGDINNNNFVMSNRAYKIALIRSTAVLTAQNPFNMNGSGAKAAGYIDMVGGANDRAHLTNPDNIFGFVKAPARCSASVAMRRNSLDESNDNSKDFDEVSYVTLSNEDVEAQRPRNSAAGARNPFSTISPPGPTGNTLLIWQIGAATDGNINRSFVELYNNSSNTINLAGYSLQYAAGYSRNSGNGAPLGNTSTDGPWMKIDLVGSIGPYSSFLILGAAKTTASADSPPALAFEKDYGDMNVSHFDLNNRAAKVALVNSTDLLTVQNPFNSNGVWGKVPGYVDMVGAINTTGTDYIQGYEVDRITNLNKQAGQRRKSLTDSDNNAADFERAVFSQMVTKTDGVITPIPGGAYELNRPKNQAYGAWDPITGDPR